MDNPELMLLYAKRKELRLLLEKQSGPAKEALLIVIDQAIKDAIDCKERVAKGELIGEISPAITGAEDFLCQGISLIKEHTGSDRELAHRLNDLAQRYSRD